MPELNKTTLEELIRMIVPLELGPDKELENNKPLLGVYLSGPEDIEKYRTKIDGNKVVFACILDMGELKRQALKATEMKGWEKPNNLDGRHIINIRDNISYYQAGFSLAHEVGHLIDCLSSEKTMKELVEGNAERAERFAEMWAIKRIYELNINSSERINFLTCIEEDYV